MTRLKTALACLFAVFQSAAAAPEDPGGWRIEAPDRMAPGEIANLELVFDINSPWQMYAPSSLNDAIGVVGLAISLDAPEGFAVSQPDYPRPVNMGRYEVYEGPQATARIKVRADADAMPGTYRLQGQVQYQFCKPTLCLPPQRDKLALVIEVE